MWIEVLNIINWNIDIDKDKVYLIWIMKKFISNLHKEFWEEFINLSNRFHMIILTDEEKEFFFETRLFNFYRHFWNRYNFVENLKTCKFKLWSWYSLYFFCLEEDKNMIQYLVKNHFEEIQFIFKSQKYEKLKNMILDIFWLYWSYNYVKMIAMYLELWYFSFRKLTSMYNHWCDYWCWKWNLEIDIKIMKKIVKEWKEKFQEKMNLLYLINKNILLTDFLFSFSTFFYKILPEIKTNESKKNLETNIKEFKWLMTTIIYLCCYITKEYLWDYIFDWKKRMMKQYTDWGDKSENELKESYNNTTIKNIKNLMLLKDEQSSRNLEKWKSK